MVSIRFATQPALPLFAPQYLREPHANVEKFYKVLGHELQRELAVEGSKPAALLADPIDLQFYLEQLHSQINSLVLVIDEFESVPDVVLEVQVQGIDG